MRTFCRSVYQYRTFVNFLLNPVSQQKLFSLRPTSCNFKKIIIMSSDVIPIRQNKTKETPRNILLLGLFFFSVGGNSLQLDFMMNACNLFVHCCNLF